MEQVLKIRTEAKAFRKKGLYEKALESYGKLWNDFRSECNEWDGWGYAYCLRKEGGIKNALDVSREVYRINSGFEPGRNLYAWCIYDSEIAKDHKKINENESVFFKAAGGILKLTGQDKYSPYVRTVFKVIDYLASKPSVRYDEILQWTDKLDFNKLSLDCFSFTDGRGKKRETRSDLEKWYAIRTKALEKLECFDECMELCEKALSSLPKFHYNNDVWFKRRIAIALGKTGREESAVSELKDILKIKKDWFIQHEISRLYFKQGNIEKAFGYAVDAALNFGDLEYKWELFQLMSQILLAQDKKEPAAKHAILAFKLRTDKNWKIPASLKDIMEKLQIQDSESVTSKNLHKELKKYWHSEKFAGRILFKGKIKNILKNGIAGFIAGDEGNDFYFKIKSFQGPVKRLKKGLAVRFYTETNPDPKKCDIAVHIKEAK